MGTIIIDDLDEKAQQGKDAFVNDLIKRVTRDDEVIRGSFHATRLPKGGILLRAPASFVAKLTSDDGKRLLGQAKAHVPLTRHERAERNANLCARRVFLRLGLPGAQVNTGTIARALVENHMVRPDDARNVHVHVFDNQASAFVEFPDEEQARSLMEHGELVVRLEGGRRAAMKARAFTAKRPEGARGANQAGAAALHLQGRRARHDEQQVSQPQQRQAARAPQSAPSAPNKVAHPSQAAAGERRHHGHKAAAPMAMATRTYADAVGNVNKELGNDIHAALRELSQQIRDLRAEIQDLKRANKKLEQENTQLKTAASASAKGKTNGPDKRTTPSSPSRASRSRRESASAAAAASVTTASTTPTAAQRETTSAAAQSMEIAEDMGVGRETIVREPTANLQ
jgi:hypothetical protein